MVGSLDLQRVLRDGEHAFSPGLLARAHGGVLYVDEVNLLHDHLVDVLLDAAAMGRVHIERDGISHSHEARFVLIGTMNPEEGELRPQLLDRFGLTVDVHASRDVDVRVQVIRQRMAYEADPDGVRRALRRRRRRAGRGGSPRRAPVVDDVALPDNELRRIAALCAAFDVDGMRADLVVARTAVAHAAWRGARHRRGAGHPGGRRAGAAAPAPPRPVRRSRASIATSWTRPWRRAGCSGSATRSRARSRSARRRRAAGRDAGAHIRDSAGLVGEPPTAEAQRAAVDDVPHPGAGGSGGRRGRTGTAVAGPQRHRQRGARPPTATTPARRARTAPVRHPAVGRRARRGRAAAARSPTMCAGRSARAAKAIW